MTNTLRVSQWLPYWQPKPQTRLRLFCFPYAGGGASLFRTWSPHLSAEIDLCPVQLPGRENRVREDPFTQLTPLVENLAQALLPYLDMPYAFFGHSMGSLICFELARYLRRQEIAREPVHLIVSGHRAPQIPDSDLPTYHLPDEDFIAELRRLRGTPEEVLQSKELLRLILPFLRADFEISESYLYTREKPLSCPISAYGGIEDSEASRSEISAWREQTSGSFKLQFFVGDHFFIHSEQTALLRVLSKDLFPYLH